MGMIDADIVERELEMYRTLGMDPQDMKGEWEKLNSMETHQFTSYIRQMMEGVLAPAFNHPLLTEAQDSCDQTSLSVPTSHCGDYNVNVLVHTPKAISHDTKRPCIVYAHGGGAVAGTAAMYAPFLSYMAMDCGVVVFNVDYRLAPETRCPNNVLDFYEAIKYVSANAADLGVDPARIAMAGESGGGYICPGAIVQLAIPIIPMLDDYEFTCRLSMTTEESEGALMM